MRSKVRGKTVGMDAEVRVAPRGRSRQGRGDGEGVARTSACSVTMESDFLMQAQGEEVVFEGFGSIETPGVVGERLDELGFDGARRAGGRRGSIWVKRW